MRFFTEHLAPGERLGEMLFGLIMTLTFTLGAGHVGRYGGRRVDVAADRDDRLQRRVGRDRRRAADTRPHLRPGRLVRLGHAIAAAADEQRALEIVAGELDETLVPITSEATRIALYRDVVGRVRSSPRSRPTMTWADVRAALAVFCLVFFASLPAALPYLLIHDPWIALRTSNALLIGMLFWVGYRWAGYTNFKPLQLRPGADRSGGCDGADRDSAGRLIVSGSALGTSPRCA